MKMQILGGLLALATAFTAQAQGAKKPLIIGDVKADGLFVRFYGKVACTAQAVPENDMQPSAIIPLVLQVAVATGQGDNFNLGGELMGENVGILGLNNGIIRITLSSKDADNSATAQGELMPGNQSVELTASKNGYVYSIVCLGK